MKRFAITKLIEWKNNPQRKPLIIRGARQVGKTWLMKAFAEEAFSDYVYINFEDNALVKDVFAQDFDIIRIREMLSLIAGKTITESTLLLFDEVQQVPRGITALKYFYEKAPSQPIIVAGSMLGIALHRHDSFPVGKVTFLDLYPLSFLEFLYAVGEELLAQAIQRNQWTVISPFRDKLIGLLRLYFLIGGMPEVVAGYTAHHDLHLVRQTQEDILNTYDRDFSKHAPNAEVPRIRMVWNSVIGQLAKENRKFLYGLLRQGARAKEFELAIAWLIDAGLVHRIPRTKSGQLPLSAFEDFSAFKLYFLDIGLLVAKAQLAPQTILQGNSLFETFKGALTEQYVLQQLKAIGGMGIYYWSADNSRGEIDFLVQQQSVIHPIEVKAEENLQAKSLRKFVEQNPQLHGLRFSMSDYREQDWLTNIPLYGIEGFMAAR